MLIVSEPSSENRDNNREGNRACIKLGKTTILRYPGRQEPPRPLRFLSQDRVNQNPFSRRILSRGHPSDRRWTSRSGQHRGVNSPRWNRLVVSRGRRLDPAWITVDTSKHASPTIHDTAFSVSARIPRLTRASAYTVSYSEREKKKRKNPLQTFLLHSNRFSRWLIERSCRIIVADKLNLLDGFFDHFFVSTGTRTFFTFHTLGNVFQKMFDCERRSDKGKFLDRIDIWKRWWILQKLFCLGFY